MPTLHLATHAILSLTSSAGMLVRETGEAVSKWDCYPLEMFLKLVVLLLEWSLQFTLLAGGKKSFSIRGEKSPVFWKPQKDNDGSVLASPVRRG